MSSDVALRIEGLGKKYTIRHKDHDHVTLAQSALHRLRHPRGALGREEFWALRDVSFEVPRGEVLGVIGHNGAGKSTLLKVLSRITPPTAGRVEVFGRIGSLLEVGTGFHPELTGRENIYLNGSILGMRRREIDRQFDAIVDFSGTEKFLDTPVKRFSSGMYVRLAFAVAAHLNTEILLLDEVLAVGDSDFQRRCIGKMRDVAQDGRTVVLVSHNLSTIKNLARQAVLLDHGRVTDIGDTHDVVDAYRNLGGAVAAESVDLRDVPRLDTNLSGAVLLRDLRLVTPDGTAVVAWGSSPELVAGLTGAGESLPISFSLTVRDPEGAPVGVCEGDQMSVPPVGDEVEVRLRLPALRLQPGMYSLDVAIGNGSIRATRNGVDKVNRALTFEVLEATTEGRSIGRWWAGFGAVDLGPIQTSHVVSVAQVESV